MSNITIFGAGNIGSAVAGIAVKAGATMQVIDCNPDKAASSTEGVTGAKFGEAITGDIVVLALPFPAYEDVFATYGDQLAGKTVDAGALKRAQYLEGYGALQIVLGVTNQTPWTGGFKVVK